MVEQMVGVGGIVLLLPYLYTIRAIIEIHSRYRTALARLPRIFHVQLVLTSADLTQVPDTVIIPVTVEVINLHRGEPPVVPGPNRLM